MSISEPVASQKTCLPQLCSPQAQADPWTFWSLSPEGLTVPSLVACLTLQGPGGQARGLSWPDLVDCTVPCGVRGCRGS